MPDPSPLPIDSAPTPEKRRNLDGKRRRAKKLPVWLQKAETERLIAAADAEIAAAKTKARRRRGQRDRLLILVGLLMGLRVSEMVKFRIEHLDMDGGRALVSEGKGAKDRFLPVRADLVALLREWIGERREGWVFASGRGGTGRLGVRAVQRMVMRLAVAAGIIKRMSPHKLRHTFASRLVETGADIAIIRDLLGHSSIQVTSVYLHADQARGRAAVDRL